MKCPCLCRSEKIISSGGWRVDDLCVGYTWMSWSVHHYKLLSYIPQKGSRYLLIYFAFVVIKSRTRGETGQEGRHPPLSPSQPRARWTALVNRSARWCCSACSYSVRMLVFYVRGFRDQTAWRSSICRLFPLFRCSWRNVLPLRSLMCFTHLQCVTIVCVCFCCLCIVLLLSGDKDTDLKPVAVSSIVP